MKIHRIYGISLRYLFYFRHSLDRLSDVFYWPTIDLLLWGLTSLYFRSQLTTNANFIVFSIISGIIFWIIVWRGQYEITVNILSELWDRNLINIFASPLKFSEWIISFVILGVIKAMISFVFASAIAYLLYKLQIFAYGVYLIPFILLLIMTGWAVGFFVAGIILRFGSKFQSLAWAFVMVFAPFSAIYYPVSILPDWAQRISSLIPSTYIFEGVREVLKTGNLDLNKIYLSLLLNVIYLALSLWYLRNSFNKVLDNGLVKVD
ncbi:MAG: ABC transporter permease [Candidatus Roizmanbacteria bacterium]|nr:MAG: ABC transporter permease [Candidatus Roizmanbacteria bacterium]